MSGKHAASSPRGRRTIVAAELVLAVAVAAVPTAVLADRASSTPAGAKPRAPWSANKLTGNKAAFDTSVGGWSTPTSGAHVATAAKPAQTGAASLALTSTTKQAGPVMVTSGSSGSTWTAAVAGARYRGWASVRAGTTGRTVTATIAFFNARGTRLDQAQGQGVADTSKKWQLVTPTVGIGPPNTAFAALELTVDKPGATETHYIDNAVLETAPGGTSRVVGPLHTAGNQIVDGNGRAIIFRGVNRTGLEGGGADDPTADDIAHANAWGANFVRVPLGEQQWMSTTCYYDPKYPSRVDAAVNMITSRGMVAMLDLHYNAITACGHVGQQPMADAPNAITFWKQVAARYKNNHLVAFDLYNEPFNLTDQIWRYGGSVTWHGTTFKAAGMQQMYDAVRGTGATNLVFVSGNTWGNWFPSTAPLAGNNIVYAIHTYTCPGEAPPNCTNGAPYDPSQFFRLGWDRALSTYPVMVTEFGWPDREDGRYIYNVIHYAETHGLGWAVFTWGASTYGQFDLLANAGPGKNYEPKPTGMAALAALPGN